MRILLDTHAFLYFIEDNPKLSTAARSVIEDGFNEPLVSVASLWEMAIKVSIGKLDLKKPFETFVPDQTAFPLHSEPFTGYCAQCLPHALS